MRAFIFICPTTKMNVQHWLDEDDGEPENEFQGISCLACARLHFINRKTGKILGNEDE
jgi:hypothetical protein